MNTVATKPCEACSFWARDRQGRCLWCECAPSEPGWLRVKWAQVCRLCAIGKRCARDVRIPKWLRWAILGGLVAGPLIVGPADEIIVAFLILLVVRRYPVVWREHAAMVDLERAVSE